MRVDIETAYPRRWEFECQRGEPLCIRYRLEARQLTVRRSLRPDFASLLCRRDVGGR